ncbi:MAG TPA: AAA family ATPase [Solirubrobacteraceae bacterium]|nr:AAA family ATPase [Solirubrobacteraceae bacterium]
MHLKAITIKGFKSFPDRTRLAFGEGVSVIVGPNGSGKSNITDAVLWALGEQSPLAVRGQSMQDVIFSGGRGVQARGEAEVELVLDNEDGVIGVPASEISISRRLTRAGEGEYRVNGARCRLIDVLELLSDTGLGKEAHSVISQGRVESIVTSKPRDRRQLIEEAAGLGKHRKRRRRAQLKLERTAENLDRALDVEREARSRLQPLKRQAEAAELHERLERQSLEARWTLAREELRRRRERLAVAELAAGEARRARDDLQGELTAVAERRQQAEFALTSRSLRHDEIAGRAFAARASHDRVELRREQARELALRLAARGERREAEQTALAAQAGTEEPGGAKRIDQLEAELALLAHESDERLALELAELAQHVAEAASEVASLAGTREHRAAERETADAQAKAARESVREAERAVEEARRESARVGAELAAANQFLRSHAGGGSRPEALERRIQVRAGYELALAAALGGRLGALIASDRGGAERLLEGAGEDGARALVAGSSASPAQGPSPAAGAERLIELVSGEEDALEVLARVLADTWVVAEIASLPEGFAGVAVTRSGRVWNAALGELTQAPSGGRERALEQRNRRDALIAEAELAAQAEQRAIADAAAAQSAAQQALDQRETADGLLRIAEREHAEGVERERLAAWLIEQRRIAPDGGELAVRRAELDGELAAERRAAERVEREVSSREHRSATLARGAEIDAMLRPQLERFEAVLVLVVGALEERLAALEEELAADRAAGEALAGELRTCTGEEAGLQARLRERSDALTTAEVQAQQVRDQAAECDLELQGLAGRLGLDALPGEEPLSEADRDGLLDRVQRLARRREQLGPVNPLAAEEYREALERADELEAQRTDLEAAIRELTLLIRDTDRQISESFDTTFLAAAQNFEDLIEDVFPGGRGQLRLVSDDSAPRPVLGGQEPGTTSGEEAAEAEAELAEALSDGEGPTDTLGVEIEVTPAGKSMRRLSLLSGGEKSMTAIAFLFAVFLARPCPFYILDEVEAALDDLNIDRFLALLRRYSNRAQFIVVTHQKRTMEAADWLYGVSMGGDGVSKVVSRRLGEAGLRELDGLEAEDDVAALSAADAA